MNGSFYGYYTALSVVISCTLELQCRSNHSDFNLICLTCLRYEESNESPGNETLRTRVKNIKCQEKKVKKRCNQDKHQQN